MALVSSAIAGTVGTAVALAAAGAGAAYMATDGFGSGSKPKAPGAIAPPTRSDASQAGKDVRRRKRTQTILTSAQGLADEDAELSTILGG